MTDIKQLKRLSIRDYLSRRGIQPARDNTRCGFYLSPFRAEHTPSFKVDYVQNLWYDFGTGEGGSIINLVMRMENCDKSALRGSATSSETGIRHYIVLSGSFSPKPKRCITVFSNLETSTMIAKGKAIAHGSNAIHYALREKKLGQLIASNLLGSREPGEIVSEFEMVNRHNERCRNKYLRFEIGIAPQDEKKLRPNDLFQIVRSFARKMNLGEHQ